MKKKVVDGYVKKNIRVKTKKNPVVKDNCQIIGKVRGLVYDKGHLNKQKNTFIL